MDEEIVTVQAAYN